MKVSNINIPCLTNENKNGHFIYYIKNILTNKYYVGSCINKRGIIDRFRRHIYHLRNNNHHSIKFQRSFNKHNKRFDIWEFELLEKTCRENYRIREQYYLDKYNAYYDGYNTTPIVGVVNYGKLSNEHKNAISKSKQNLLDSDIVDIFEKYNNGLNYNVISKYYDLSYVTVSNILNKDHYYPDVKKKYNLKMTWYSYIFYNLKQNKFHRVNNFSKFCREHNLNEKMMMPLMLGKFKMTFINGWTVFNRNKFTLSELRRRISIENKCHVLYRDGIKYQFKSVKNFCKKHMLDETSTYYVLNGKRNEIKGFSKNI